MLQCGTSAYNAVAKFTSRTTWLSLRTAALFSSNVTAAPSLAENSVKPATTETNYTDKTHVTTRICSSTIESGQVEPQVQEIKDKLLKLFDENKALVQSIDSAKSINDLIIIAKAKDQPVKVALQIMSLVTVALNSGKVNISRQQEKTLMPAIQNLLTSFDATIFFKDSLSEEEFSKLSVLSVPAMVQVISALSANKNRHSPLLKFLTENIVKNSDVLSPKICTSLLYSMCSLNYVDEKLIKKILKDLMTNMEETHVSSLTSALVSIGMLRYRDDPFLDSVCIHIFKNRRTIKPADYVNMAITFATFNKTPIEDEFLQHIQNIEQTKVSTQRWLDLVWALVILKAAKPEHYASVLSDEFLHKVKDSAVPKILKLQNINAAAKYIQQDYNGPLLSMENKIFNVTPLHTKEELKNTNALNETLMQYLRNSSCFKTSVNKGLGFLIDAIVHFNSAWKCVNITDENADWRMALILDDYDSFSRGTKELLGVHQFKKSLLSSMGYHVLTLNHECFSSFDKLTKRETYLKSVFDTFKNELK